jgi:hypothetical protein
MKAHFAPCEGCGRHIRVSESACPFCDLATSSSFRARPAPAAPNKRLSRAALFVFGAASATAVAGCSSSSDSSTTTDGGSDAVADANDTNNTAAYGLPADTSFLDTGKGDSGVPVVDAAYGGPPDTSFDSSHPDSADAPDASDAIDTTDAIDGGPAPAYGLPPDPAP